VLHYGEGIPLRRVPGVLREHCGIEVTQGALTQAAMRESAPDGALRAAYEVLRGEVATAPLVNLDATGWRVSGEGAQLVVYETEQGSFYQILSSLTSVEIRAVLGEDFLGVLGDDRAPLYDSLRMRSVRQQKCLSHLLRNLSEVAEKKKGTARRFSTRLSELLCQALALWTQWREKSIAEEEYWSEVGKLGQEITHQLCRRTLKDRDNQRLLDGIGTQHDRGHLLRFLKEPDVVDSTNNAAERGLRPNVIARKVSQCSKNWRGVAARAIFTSLIRTGGKR
jgi:hypothetical protein